MPRPQGTRLLQATEGSLMGRGSSTRDTLCPDPPSPTAVSTVPSPPGWATAPDDGETGNTQSQSGPRCLAPGHGQSRVPPAEGTGVCLGIGGGGGGHISLGQPTRTVTIPGLVGCDSWENVPSPPATHRSAAGTEACLQRPGKEEGVTSGTWCTSHGLPSWNSQPPQKLLPQGNSGKRLEDCSFWIL